MSINAATAVSGLVIEAIRNMVLLRMGRRAVRSAYPNASK
jgi:hypothetical protein